MPLIHHRLACSLALAALLAAGAAPGQTIGVRTLALRAGEMPEVFLRGSKDHHPLKFSAVQPSPVVRAAAANPLPIYKSALDQEGKPAFTVVQQVKLPSGAKGVLLLGWSAGDTIRYVAMEDDFGSAGFNDWLLINTTARPIAFKVGEKAAPVQVAPGSSRTYKIATDKNKGAAVLAQAPFDGKAKTFYSTYWPVHAGKRAVVLFVEDGQKIRVKRISDALAPANPAGDSE